MTAVGIDLSITATGLASSDGKSRIIGSKGITTLPLADRVEALKNLRFDIVSWVTSQEPKLVLIEAPAFSRAGGGAVERHFLYLDVIDHILGRGIPLVEVTTNQRMTYATGKGQASKNAIVDAVARRWPQFETGGNDNLCDAIVLAAMGAERLGQPLAIVPRSHSAALLRIAWPVLIGDNS